jgi:hypothetical protein
MAVSTVDYIQRQRPGQLRRTDGAALLANFYFAGVAPSSTARRASTAARSRRARRASNGASSAHGGAAVEDPARFSGFLLANARGKFGDFGAGTLGEMARLIQME